MPRKRMNAGDPTQPALPPDTGLSTLLPYRILQEAIRAVPAIRYALGVAGIVSVVAIVREMGVRPAIAIWGSLITLVLMVLLVLFAKLAAMSGSTLKPAVLVFTWSILVLVIATATLLFSSVFFRKPVDLEWILSTTAPAERPHGTDDSDMLIRSAKQQSAAKDYAGAWDALQQAAMRGPVAPKVRDAQIDVAMEWLRGIYVVEPHTFAEIVDKLLPILSQGAATAKATRAADIFAHIGLGYSLKERDGAMGLGIEQQFHKAIDLDRTNPYANAMWGFWIATHHGKIEDIADRFALARSSNREGPYVRRLEVGALMGSDDAGYRQELLRAVDRMRKADDPYEESSRSRLISDLYAFADEEDKTAPLLSALSPREHLATFLWLTKNEDRSTNADLDWWQATLTEATGDFGQALLLYFKVAARSTTFDDQVRVAIARCASKAPGGVQTVLDSLNSHDPLARTAAAYGLALINAPPDRAIPALVQAIKDSDAQVRCGAASSLGKFGGAPAIAALVISMRDQDRQVRQSASEALVSIGAPAVNALAELLNADDTNVRSNALDSLGKLAPTVPKAMSIVIRAMGSKEESVRYDAIGAIDDLGADAAPAVPALISVLKGDSSKRVRYLAAYTLGEVGPPASPAVPALIDALNDAMADSTDPGGENGQQAADALGKIGPAAASAVPVLIKGLNSDQMRVPGSAAEALGRIGAAAKSAIAPLAEAVKNQDDPKYLDNYAKPLAAIAQALAEKGDTQQFADVRKALRTMEAAQVPAETLAKMRDAVDRLESPAAKAK